MYTPAPGDKVKIKDFSNRPFQEDDEKNFFVKTIAEEKLIDTAEGLDYEEEFEKSMLNYGDFEDLPDSDRETICRSKGINIDNCLKL